MTAPSSLVQPEKDLAARAVPHMSQSPLWTPIGGPSPTPIDSFWEAVGTPLMRVIIILA
jgi:hypothetical protein